MTKDKRYWQAFSGDINEYVYSIQDEDYRKNLGYIYGIAHEAYIGFAEQLLTSYYI